jgi:hypothetical protein
MSSNLIARHFSAKRFVGQPPAHRASVDSDQSRTEAGMLQAEFYAAVSVMLIALSLSATVIAIIGQ